MQISCKGSHRPTSEVLRKRMRELIERQRRAGAYNSYLAGKVETGRASMYAGDGRADDEVEAKFAARRSRADGTQ